MDPEYPAQEPTPPQPAAPISDSAERARRRLHEEIERVRAGVEEMLAEQAGPADPELRRELDALREETRTYVKRRVRKSEKRIDHSLSGLDQRLQALELRLSATEQQLSAAEQRLGTSEQERRYSEWRIHTNNEAMLDGLLRQIRSIADLLARTR